MQTKRPGSRNRCKAAAAAEKPQVHLLGRDPAAQLCKAALFRLARQQVRPAGRPGAAAFGAELLLRHHSGYEAKKVELNQGVKTCHTTPGSRRTQNGDSRQQSRGTRGTECHNKRSSTLLSKTSGWHFKCNAKSLAKQSSPGATCLERPSVFFLFPTFNNCQCLTFLFSFLMCLLNPISIQEPWLIEKKPNP